jgi:hypothetical protein
LLQLQQILPGGTLRKRIDGTSEYAIVGIDLVQRVCEQLLPYLQVKQRQAVFLIQITKYLSSKKSQLGKKLSPQEFLRLCHIVDKIGELNDSKKTSWRGTTSATIVETYLKKLFPVETSMNTD